MRHMLRCGMVALAGVLASSGCTSTNQQELRYNAGRAISTRMLQDLINPYRSEYRIALINSTVGTAWLISSPDEPPRAELIRGHENWLWAQAAEQLQGSTQMSLLIARTTLDSGNCPALPQALQDFFAETEPLLGAQLAHFPLAKDLAARAASIEEITVDGVTYLLHIVTADSTLTFTLPSATDSELWAPVVAVMSSLGQCTNGLEPEIDTIYGLF